MHGIHEARPATASHKELKILIPSRQILKLHELKVMDGRGIASMVEVALREYFATLKAPVPVPLAGVHASVRAP